jgi:hypothetical protein
MRKLNGNDLFTLLAIIGKLGIRDTLLEGFRIAGDGADAGSTGIEVMATIVSQVLLNVESVRDDINILLGRLMDIHPDEVGEMDAGDYMDAVFAMLTDGGLAAFFTRLLSRQGKAGKRQRKQGTLSTTGTTTRDS